MIINETDLTADEVRFLELQGFEVVQQGSEEWLEERLGIPTASNYYKIMDWTKGTKTTEPAPKAPYYSYMMELLAERLAGKQARFVSSPMQWGIYHEQAAADLYEEITGSELRTVGFKRHEILATGASLDREVGEDGCVEIKCPNTSTHIGYMLDGPPPQYFAQMQGQMWVANKQWCDFMTFDPDMPEGLQHKIFRVERDDEYIEQLEHRIIRFLGHLQAKEDRIRNEVQHL